MKKIMELLQNMKAKNEKKDNKGFSLVELIIVIAIMAILVGIVGTQVIPYISKSKVAKDQQVLNSISTAAVAAYSENGATGNVTIDNVFTGITGTDDASKTAEAIRKGILSSSGFDTLDNFKKALGSDAGKVVTAVKVEFKAADHKVITSVSYSTNGDQAPKYPINNVEATL